MDGKKDTASIRDSHDVEEPGVAARNVAPMSGADPKAPRRPRDRKLYVRVSEREKQAILARAEASELSLSRYLARVGLEGKPPPDAEERRHLEGQLLLFRRALQSVNRVHDEATALRIFEVLPGFEEDLDAALETLGDLIRSVARRV